MHISNFSRSLHVGPIMPPTRLLVAVILAASAFALLPEGASRIFAQSAGKNAVNPEVRQVEREIEATKSKIERLKLWGSCTLILGSRTSSQAVALDEVGESFRLADAADGDFVAQALVYAWKSGVDRVWNPEAQRLTTDILRTVKRGETLPSPLDQRLRKSFWTVPKFAGVAGSERDPPVVVFQSVHERKQRVGMFLGISGDELAYRPLAATEAKVTRPEIVPGSLRVDTGAELVAAAAVEQGGTFLDFCILQAAHRLSPADDRPAHPIVAVHVDVRCEAIRSTKAAARLSRRESQHFRDVGSLLGIEPGEEIPTDVCTALNRLARRAEDRIYDKLVALGIAITERKFLDNVLAEQDVKSGRNRQATSTVDRADLLKVARQHEATHVLVARIEEPATLNSQFYLSMRLIDLRSNQPVLSLSGENLAPREDSASPIFLHSGRLAWARWKDRNKRGPFPGIEQPPIVPVTIGLTGGKTPSRCLVIEETAGAGDAAAFRPLFSRNVERRPWSEIDLVPASFETLRMSDDPEVRSQLHRYIVWHMAKPAMTPAGRIVAAYPEAGNVETTLGLKHGLAEGAKLRVARPVELLSSNLQSRVGKLPIRLPTMLTVSELEEDGSRAFLKKSGKTGYWDDASMQPREGDLVFARFTPQHRIAVYTPQVPEPQPKTTFNWNEPGLRDELKRLQLSSIRVTQTGQTIADQLRVRLRDAFKTQGIQTTGDSKPMSSADEELQDAISHDATIICSGRMYPVIERSNLRWRVEMRLEEILVESGSTKRGQLLAELEAFTIARDGKDW